jgi:hypothetical protein
MKELRVVAKFQPIEQGLVFLVNQAPDRIGKTPLA